MIFKMMLEILMVRERERERKMEKERGRMNEEKPLCTRSRVLVVVYS